MPTIITTLGSLFYTKHGDQGPTVICIHGAGGSHLHWGYQLRNLATTAQVIALDLPGHGRSDPPGHMSVDNYSKAVIAFMDALECERVILLGHSMGGAISMWTALAAPERVAALGLIGTGGRLRVLPQILDGLADEHQIAATIQFIVEHAYVTTTPESIIQQGIESYAACDPAIFRGDFIACNNFDILTKLPAIHQASAIIIGAEDQLTPPKYGDTLRTQMPNATLSLIPDAGHMVMIEQYEAVNSALQTFITSTQSS
ncbi:MAG: alpha/beta fold hydrolase [Chloroflexi bacterium AL-W]|nr:alpha/beta fold hydrolase [Chloroflexi bacterium AL-N1]NOK66771.1 alpha/beta fold hydrolase [Chloroflexi bacterium AL-N10]NOK74937.1 alpha/beta fold hydrolase [Chloroflexi bacterium AL-N5]NOK81374.1 alpha/beta fold hydrolase [Chloroflexi bacterium AL-W]NOK88843.1 alpha/beta fold hydrolase [Chloroflexi bacterium AL-N15]